MFVARSEWEDLSAKMPHSFNLNEAAGKEDRDVLGRAEADFDSLFKVSLHVECCLCCWVLHILIGYCPRCLGALRQPSKRRHGLKAKPCTRGGRPTG